MRGEGSRGVRLDGQIARQNVNRVQVLALVLMQSFDLNVKKSPRGLNAMPFVFLISAARSSFVGGFNRSELFKHARVVGKLREFCSTPTRHGYSRHR
jgi:hypothetical protein